MDARTKQLRFRAWRRGFRELDLILGGFADRFSANLGPAELDAFDALLAANDQDVYAWIIGASPPPPQHATALLRAIQAHIAAGGAETLSR